MTIKEKAGKIAASGIYYAIEETRIATYLGIDTQYDEELYYGNEGPHKDYKDFDCKECRARALVTGIDFELREIAKRLESGDF